MAGELGLAELTSSSLPPGLIRQKNGFYHTENVIESICFSFLAGIFGDKRIL